MTRAHQDQSSAPTIKSTKSAAPRHRLAVQGGGRWRPRPVWAASVVLAALAFAAAVTIAVQPHVVGGDLSRTQYWSFDTGAAADGRPLNDFQVVDRGRSESPPAVGPNGLTHGAALEPNSAVYVQRQLPGPVVRMGVTANFAPAAGGGAVALLAPSQDLSTNPDTFDANLPNMGIHFVFDANSWVMSVWRRDGGPDVLGTGQFVPPLAGSRSAEVTRRSDEVVLSLPDGSTRRFEDRRIADWSSSRAAWELYEGKVGDVPASITQIWVSWGAT